MPRGRSKETAEEAPDYTPYLGKEPTDLQARFAEWLKDLGYDPATAKTKDEAFREGVRLGVALRMQFQASPENQAVLEERRVAAAEKAEEPKPPKGRRKRAAAVEADEEPEAETDEDEDEDEEPEEEPKLKARTTRRKAAAPAAKTTTRTPRRKAAVKTSDAPF